MVSNILLKYFDGHSVAMGTEVFNQSSVHGHIVDTCESVFQIINIVDQEFVPVLANDFEEVFVKGQFTLWRIQNATPE